MLNGVPAAFELANGQSPEAERSVLANIAAISDVLKHAQVFDGCDIDLNFMDRFGVHSRELKESDKILALEVLRSVYVAELVSVHIGERAVSSSVDGSVSHMTRVYRMNTMSDRQFFLVEHYAYGLDSGHTRQQLVRASFSALPDSVVIDAA